MIINDEQRVLLLKYVPNSETYIENDDLCELELALDAQITENGMDENFELTDLGLKLQLLYDQIYNQNT